MNYFSTRDIEKKSGVTLRQAILMGLSDDGGLFMPERIPVLEKDFFDNIHNCTFQEIALEVSKQFLENEIDTNELKLLIDDVINFEIPVVKVENDIYSMELFHGPTLAFKDVGARFMSRLLGFYASDQEKKYTIIVATSGDTGSAVAAGFYNVPGIQVYILYPKEKVSPLQEKQLTTWGGNITALEINGTFDDCQRLAKELLSDYELNSTGTFTSANSINIARLIPQMFYYFWAYARVKEKDKAVVISVPCGNFGNLTAGILAQKMGLPITYFVASTNANDVIPEFLRTGLYNSRKSIQTISNAMDVGNPSNFERLNELFNGDLNTFKKHIKAKAFSDLETKQAIVEVFKNTGYKMDPHGAIAYLGLKQFIKTTGEVGVFLETAHPVKFLNVMEQTLNMKLDIPPSLNITSEKKNFFRIQNNLDSIKQVILDTKK